MKFKVASGLQITTSTWGSQNDPLVILLHGGGQTRHAWGLTGKKLSQSDFYVIALDLRGHGDSDWDKGGDYSIDAFKGDLASI
ncbi:MAG: alpha/beta hydrolase, partial [Gammaproteobacteria bacterium]